MEAPSYIATNLEELFEKAPLDIQHLIEGDEVNDATAILGKLHKLPVSSYVALENIISFILIGALKPEDAVRGIVDILHLNEEDAYKLASDLDKTILEKARISILGKSSKDIVTLSFQEGRTPNELRKEILDTTKREPVLPVTVPASTGPVTLGKTEQSKSVVSGSRSQLMEQLQVLDDIPNDEEISERLKKIQEQIAGMNAVKTPPPTESIPLEEDTSQIDQHEVVSPEQKSASYSKAPTKYNVDPYREVVDSI